MAEMLPPLVLELRADASKANATITGFEGTVDGMVTKTETATTKSQGAFSRMTGAVGGAVGKLGSTIGGEMGHILSEVSDTFTQISERGMTFSQKLGAIGAGATVAGLALTSMGSADKRASDMLKLSLENAGVAWTDYQDRIEEAVKANQNFGFSDDQTQTALAKLTDVMGDPAKALDKMSLVADLAAKKHIDLSSAAALVGKAYMGNTRVLKEFGIEMPKTQSAVQLLAKAQDESEKAADKVRIAQEKLSDAQGIAAIKGKDTVASRVMIQKAENALRAAQENSVISQEKLTKAQEAAKNATGKGAEALDKLAEKTKGAAATGVNNFNGQIGIMKTKIEDAVNAFGNQFGPAITIAGGALQGLTAIMALSKAMQEANTLATMRAKVVQGISTAATWAQAAAQWALNSALLANPITWIILAVIALVAAFVLLWNNNKAFRDFFIDMGKKLVAMVQGIGKWFGDIFKGIGDVIGSVIAWVKKNWPLLLAILTGPIGLAVKFIIDHWSQITEFFQGFLKNVGDIMASVGNVIAGGFKSAIDFVIDIINNSLGIVNSFIDGINNALTGLKWVSAGTLDFKVGHLPELPHLDVGGTIPGAPGAPVLMVGHGGEEVLSREMLAGRAPIPAKAMQAMAAQSSAASATGSRQPASQNVTVNVQTNASPLQIASSVGWTLRQLG